MKQHTRLTESYPHRIVNRTVKNVLKEESNFDPEHEDKKREFLQNNEVRNITREIYMCALKMKENSETLEPSTIALTADLIMELCLKQQKEILKMGGF